MHHDTSTAEAEARLRVRALERLGGHPAATDRRGDATAALSALYHLASSPVTAAEALALTHELQVHQVELEVQHEEMLSARTDLEATLHRQIQLYEQAPFAYLTIDEDTRILELNSMAARLLGNAPRALLGRGLATFLAPESHRALRALLGKLDGGSAIESCTLQTSSPTGAVSSVHASVSVDAAPRRYLLACLHDGTPLAPDASAASPEPR